MGTLKNYEQELKKLKRHGFPRDINFSFDNNGKTLRSELVDNFSKKDFRRFDPYTLACILKAEKADIFCYVVNNRFHPRFDSILRFYSTEKKTMALY